MPMVMNYEVKMNCKAVTYKLFTVVVILVEYSTSIEKPKGSLKEYFSIRQYSIKATSIIPVIPPSFPSSFFYIDILRFNSRSHKSIG